jgi:acetolactate synthase I/II/III large subunit
MIKLSDYLVRSLADRGVRHVFLVTGGGAMHLNDSLGRESRITYICHHHEQAAAMAAEGYARVSGRVGVVNVTTGPGAINALNGVFGAWADSIPMLVISGQVKRDTCMAFHDVPSLRQLGDQEVDIIRMVHGITKYAALVREPSSIRYHLERAYNLALLGRPGPCWLDIPIDVQAATIDESGLPPYDPAQDTPDWDSALLPDLCRTIITRIQHSHRPVVLAGTGVRLASAIAEFHQVVRILGIPVTTAWAHDIMACDDELFCGRPGTIGQRTGNFTVQNADTLLVLGSRLNIRQVSYNWSTFARNAFKIQVDIDRAELSKPTVRPDLPVHADVKTFLAEMLRQLRSMAYVPGAHASWLAWCRERVIRYPAVRPEQRCGPQVNPYYFIEHLFANLEADDIVICGNATACIVPFQAGHIKHGQRLISNSGAASMGHDLPAAIGAAVARGGKRVICLAGDGSAQFNIQELQTVVHHRLPVKIFVLNNGGYLSIRTTQSNFFTHFVGEGPSSGVSFPDFTKVAAAYGIPTCRIDTTDQLNLVGDILDTPGPVLCEVTLDRRQEFEPRLKSRQLDDGTIVSPALEDMFPFLDESELKTNLLTDTI